MSGFPLTPGLPAYFSTRAPAASCNPCLPQVVSSKGGSLTKDAHGNDVQLVDESLYESVYEGKTVTRSFGTMKKSLFGETFISQHIMTRTIRPAYAYKLYE